MTIQLFSLRHSANTNKRIHTINQLLTYNMKTSPFYYRLQKVVFFMNCPNSSCSTAVVNTFNSSINEMLGVPPSQSTILYCGISKWANLSSFYFSKSVPVLSVESTQTAKAIRLHSVPIGSSCSQSFTEEYLLKLAYIVDVFFVSRNLFQCTTNEAKPNGHSHVPLSG